MWLLTQPRSITRRTNSLLMAQTAGPQTTDLDLLSYKPPPTYGTRFWKLRDTKTPLISIMRMRMARTSSSSSSRPSRQRTLISIVSDVLASSGLPREPSNRQSVLRLDWDNRMSLACASGCESPQLKRIHGSMSFRPVFPLLLRPSVLHFSHRCCVHTLTRSGSRH